MPHRLYVVHGSHPCRTASEAPRLKGIPFRTVELPPPAHALLQRLRFGARTVPGLVLADGERVQGSRAIVRAAERLVAEPSLLPADPQRRAAMEEAERWGEEVLQPIPRRLLWTAFSRRPRAMLPYSEGSRLRLPGAVLLAAAPLATRVERRLNAATPEAVAADLRALPAHAERIEGWIEDGRMGGAELNAADLQIGATVALLLTIADVRGVFSGGAAEALAHRVWPDPAGEIPAGVLAA